MTTYESKFGKKVDGTFNVEGTGDQYFLVHSTDNNKVGIRFKRPGWDKLIENEGGALNFYGGNDDATNLQMVLSDGGNLGVGTVPSKIFHVKHTSSDCSVRIETTAGSTAIMDLVASTGGNFFLRQNGTTDVFSVDSSGNVTTTNGTSGGVTHTFKTGAVNASGTNNGHLELRRGGGGTAKLWFRYENSTNPVNECAIKCSSSSANMVFETSGSYASKTGGGTWGTLSDRRIKTDEREIEDALGKVCSLQPKHFKYINAGEDANPCGTQTGFIAQDLQEVFPGHVFEMDPMVEADKKLTPEGEKLLGINPDFMPYVVKAIQELKQENDELKARVEALESN